MTRLTVVDVLARAVSRGDRTVWAGALVDQCSRSLDAIGVGLAVAGSEGLVGIAAATPGAGRAGEDLQFSLGEGPCHVASRTKRAVHAPTLFGDGRWIQFAREASRAGIGAAFSSPLQVGAVLVGVLDVYRAAPGPLSLESATVLTVYAEAATAVLLLTHADDAGNDAGELAELADIRPVVHQAAGMVAVQLDVDLTTALLRLRAHAFASGRPLRDLAADVVARRLRLDDTPEGAHVPLHQPDAGDDLDPGRSGTDLEERNPDGHP